MVKKPTYEELEQRIKEIPDIPVILCTGLRDSINEDKAEKMGIRAFVMKPIARSEIARSIRTVLDQQP